MQSSFIKAIGWYREHIDMVSGEICSRFCYNECDKFLFGNIGSEAYPVDSGSSICSI